MAAAAGDGAVKPLQCAMKLANGAIELDTGNRPREAYTEYLRSIHYISQVLLEEVETTKEGGEIVAPDTSKMLKLAEQCLERAQSTAAKLGKTHLKPAMPVAAPVPPSTSRHRRVYSDEGGKLSPFLPPEIFQKLQVVESQSSKKELTPLEEASLQNQKLKAAYEARMARLDPSQAMQKTSLTLSLQRQMMENLVIAKAREETLQRKMEERRLRLQEAANSLVSLPRRFCSQVALTPEEREQRALYAAILEYEQDHDWPKHWRAQLKKSPGDLSLVTSLVSHLLSIPDHPISQLLKKLQCAVYRALYPIVSRGAVGAASAPGCCSLPPDADGLLAPGSRRLRPSQSLYCMLSPADPSPAPRPPDGTHASPPTPPPHTGPPERGLDSSPVGPPSPLAHSFTAVQGKDSSFEDLEHFLATSEGWGRGHGRPPEPQTTGVKKEPLLEQLKSAVKDIHNAIDRLLSLTLLAFEGLSAAASKDRCLACIEEPFFSPLWPLLLALYRSVHRLREAALSRSMELYRNAPPAAIGIPSKLLPRDLEATGAGAYPYCAAAQELGLLVLESCPQKKLECIVRVLRVICACAEDYYRAQEAAPEARPQLGAAAIGADDLLPILSFVVLRSGLPQLVSECAALEEFIHEGYLIGEEGYCLTSLQSALSYVELLPRGALGK
ncbi:VPS9 domain-containing protein 1 isoform X2 [Canis lupus baileyi]|uniref:VPS9 domain containing 1 n=3 Tax=Canis lupus familiaris TaxID=9615 RepID=A0A8I3MLS5_CANLF|nr:VPS9 domain-containing protein 1 isoform X2 [Canis lupus dingo]XP_038380933.1 VPS9 domain-containing protein 1 isoform X1 [Canis lupus familiaris]XP_038393921.1 VPS9 domain-containing protein 1 isoform X1 [Canis lupus familiaris]XP_038522660.1 VPS9 domain-containing protein 1 isoform X1 [Canis lupus familiaris]